MICPKCKQHDNSKVVDTRPYEDSVRRRRQCLGCGKRITTYEVSDSIYTELRELRAMRKELRQEAEAF